jgi:hypothetical protein
MPADWPLVQVNDEHVAHITKSIEAVPRQRARITFGRYKAVVYSQEVVLRDVIIDPDANPVRHLFRPANFIAA